MKVGRRDDASYRQAIEMNTWCGRTYGLMEMSGARRDGWTVRNDDQLDMTTDDRHGVPTDSWLRDGWTVRYDDIAIVDEMWHDGRTVQDDDIVIVDDDGNAI